MTALFEHKSSLAYSLSLSLSLLVYLLHVDDSLTRKNTHSRSGVKASSLIFTKTTFCQRGNTKRMAHILSNFRSSGPIRTHLKSINHASKYRIYHGRSHHIGAHFTEIRCFAIKKDAQNVQTRFFPRKYAQKDAIQVKIFIMTTNSLFEVQNTNNSDFGCY